MLITLAWLKSVILLTKSITNNFYKLDNFPKYILFYGAEKTFKFNCRFLMRLASIITGTLESTLTENKGKYQ